MPVLFLRREVLGMTDHVQTADVAEPVVPDANTIALYADVSGRDLSDFQFHRVLCLFKLGVILLQLYARYRRGITKDERFEPLGRTADATLGFTLDVIRGQAV